MSHRRDRYGEVLEDDVVDHDCERGWVDRDGDHPRPCLRCRPWLAGPLTTAPPPRQGDVQ